MFFVILASMTKWSIKKKWQEIGVNGDFKALMSKCENKPTQAQMDHYQSQMPDMIEHMLDRGMITDCDFAKKYKVFGEANVDDKGMKSQRTVHLTHHAQRKAALNRLQAKKQDEKVKATGRQGPKRKQTPFGNRFAWHRRQTQPPTLQPSMQNQMVDAAKVR